MKYLAKALGFVLMVTTAQAVELGGFWANWDTSEYGKSGGYGLKLALSEKGQETQVELRGSIFSDLAPEESGETLEVIPIELGTRFPIVGEGSLSAYLGLGAGYYLMDMETQSVDDEFGYYGLLGLQLRMGKTFSLFGEIMYRMVEASTDIQDYKLDGLGVNAGIAVAW
jgi:hypothetical protein